MIDILARANRLTLVGASLLLALLIVLCAYVSPVLPLVLPPAAAIASAVLLQPFFGLVSIVALSFQGYYTRSIVPGFPLSYVDVLALLVAGGILLGWHRSPRSDRLRFDNLGLRLAILFYLVACVSALLSEHRRLALGTLFSHTAGLLLLYFVVTLVRTLPRMKIVLLALLVSALIASVVQIADVYGGIALASTARHHEGQSDLEVANESGAFRRRSSSNSSPTTTSQMLSAAVAIAGVLLVRSRQRLWLTVPVIVLGATAALSMYSRSGMMVLFLALGWPVVLLMREKGLFVGIAGALVLAASLLFVPSYMWTRLMEMSSSESDDTTVEFRIEQNLMGLESVKQHPVLGIGPGHFPGYSKELENRWAIPMTKGIQLHNMYLSVAVEQGLLGAVFYHGMILVALIGAFRASRVLVVSEDRMYAEGLLAAYVVFLLSAFIQPHEFINFTWILTGLALAMWQIASQSPESTPTESGAETLAVVAT